MNKGKYTILLSIAAEKTGDFIVGKEIEIVKSLR